MKQSISLDVLLTEQSKDEFLCTLETIPNDSPKVKIKPWVDGAQGCRCDSAIIIDRNLIADIFPTEEVHLCCGKKLKVVEVVFKEGASMKVEDIFKMSVERIKKKKAASDSSNRALYNQNFINDPYRIGFSDGKVYRRGQNLVLSGCGMSQRESDVCKSGCECQDIHGHWYCCPMGCCP